jgi:hypothetical protein
MSAEFVKNYCTPLSRYVYASAVVVPAVLSFFWNSIDCSDGFSKMGEHNNNVHNLELLNATNFLRKQVFVVIFLSRWHYVLLFGE